MGKNSSEFIGSQLKVINRLLVTNKEAKLKRLQEEIDKERKDRDAWKKTFVPNYFHSEWGKVFFENVTSNKENFLQTSENEFAQNSSGQLATTKNQSQDKEGDNKNIFNEKIRNKKYFIFFLIKVPMSHLVSNRI